MRSPSPTIDRQDAPSVEPLSEAQRLEMIGRMVSSVAHDFNNLLTGIVLCSELLLSGLEKGNRLRRYALEIRSAGASGADMIQQLLAVARQHPTVPVLFSMNEAIEGMRSLLTRLVGENVELTADLQADPSTVQMSPAHLYQIVLNLVLNSRDAMPEGGRITIQTHTSGQDDEPRRIALEITDTGVGMDASTRSHIFEPFFTTKEPGKGTGLGLATVFQIVKQSAGTIEIESEPRVGTRVIVFLPQPKASSTEVSPGRTLKFSPQSLPHEAVAIRKIRKNI